ncbi:KPN_02809 family neutral zinc metallopeptidase [Oryzifoliimicrobium ureilyticus]|uniref:KPN_02809 family neutral zinc metallopeptidase n=1 Tax=Oryzifoliimicrobium ureilyticus TaxID=3113724 RepID=UPI003075F427
MEWKGRRESDNIEDRRSGGFDGGFGGNDYGGRRVRIPIGGRGGGISIGGLLVILVICWFLGINPLTLLDGGGMTPSNYDQSQSGSGAPPANDEMTSFVRTVLADTEDVWTGIFQNRGAVYEKPTLVLFNGSTQSSCGAASAATGPFYCPNDRKVYLDTNFFRQLSQQFGASGEFAEAYVVAHEVGHHVQNQLGILQKFNEQRQRVSETEANKMSVRVELQADCFAGVFGKSEQAKGYINEKDVADALNAAQQIGDDTLQKRGQGYVVPDSFNHGTSEQRVRWFKRGFDAGRIDACDTFAGPV